MTHTIRVVELCSEQERSQTVCVGCQVRDIQSCSAVGLSAEGLQLGRNGRLSLLQVCLLIMLVIIIILITTTVSQHARDDRETKFEFNDVRTSNVFNRFEIQ